MKHPYILLLEDDSDDRYITESYFKELGLEAKLDFLERGDDVLNYLEERMTHKFSLPNLILLDNHLPGTNGIEVLRQLKAHPRYKLIPVVIVSGTAHESEITECYRLGANTFIQKPSTDKLTSHKIQTFFRYWFEVAQLPVAEANMI